MRILLVAPVMPERDGAWAIPILLYAELVGLSQRHEITLVTAVDGESGEAQAAAELEQVGVDLHTVDRRRPEPFLRRWRRRWRLAATWARGDWPWRTVWFAAPEIQEVLDRLTATQMFDVVAVEDSSMSVFGLPANIPAVFTHYEVLRPRAIDWRAGAPLGWPRWALRELDWRRWRSFQHAAWQRFDRVQVFSGRDAQVVADLAPEVATRVRVNPFGIALPPPADATEVHGTVLFVGSFAHPPNRDAAFWVAHEIMPAVRARYPQARLRIVGRAPPPEVQQLSGPHVEVIADAPSVEPHLAAASVVLAPVRTGGGMRMKVLQALASGKAVVTTTRGAEGYTEFEPAPPFVIADDGDGIAAATVALLEDEPRRRELGERARAFAQRHHSPQAWATRLEAIYEEARDRRLEVARG